MNTIAASPVTSNQQAGGVQVMGYYHLGDWMKAWGITGALWGGLWGFMFGSAAFWIPGSGPILMAGPVVGGIIGALKGAIVVGGLSTLRAALVGIGIARNRVVQDETALKPDSFL